jgi:hypothetical protein
MSSSNVGPVARWLETFVCNNTVCKSYVETFKLCGYDTLADVCKLNAQQLIKMGISQMDTEKILENVSVIRQTMQANNSTNNSQQQQVVVNNNSYQAPILNRNNFNFF